VHSFELSVAQKNDPGQIAQLSAVFDFGVVEQCFVQHWCARFARYADAGRLVVDVEYGLRPYRFLTKTCPSDARYDETAILKHLSLNAYIVNCDRADDASRNSF
jgi:Glycoside-hydrolase family GH114